MHVNLDLDRPRLFAASIVIPVLSLTPTLSPALIFLIELRWLNLGRWGVNAREVGHPPVFSCQHFKDSSRDTRAGEVCHPPIGCIVQGTKDAKMEILDGNVQDKRIRAALEVLGSADLARDISMDNIARAVNLSPSRFRHLFTQEGRNTKLATSSRTTRGQAWRPTMR